MTFDGGRPVESLAAAARPDGREFGGWNRRPPFAPAPLNARPPEATGQIRRHASLWDWLLVLVLVLCLFGVPTGASSERVQGDGTIFTALKMLFAFAALRSVAIARVFRRALLPLALICAYLGAAAFSTILSGAYPSPLGYLAQTSGFCVLFLIIVSTVGTMHQFRFILKGLVISGGVIALLALAAMRAGQPLLTGRYSTDFFGISRLSYGMLNANTYAYTMVMLLAFSVYLLATTGRAGRLLYMIAAGLFLISITQTYCRGALILSAGLLTVLAIVLKMRSRLELTLIVVGVVVGLGTSSGLIEERLMTLSNVSADYSAKARSGANEAAVQAIVANPVLGLGGNNFNMTLLRGYGVHNAYYLCLLDGGIAIFVPFVMLVAFAAYRLFRKDQAGGPAWGPAHRTMGLLIGAWVIMMFLAPAEYAFWIVLGLAWSVIVQSPRDRSVASAVMVRLR
jgi:hypothetical protein